MGLCEFSLKNISKSYTQFKRNPEEIQGLITGSGPVEALQVMFTELSNIKISVKV